MLNFGQVKLADLDGAIENLEDLMRRYTSRKDAAGALLTLAEDIRMAKHVQLNGARLTTFLLLREEIVRH